MRNSRLPAELAAEFLGTFVLVLFGQGVVAMVLLFGRNQPGEIVHGGYTNITLAWGLGVTMGIYIAGRISGAHLNPAVTLALAVFRGFPWRKLIPYSLAQTAGAFAAAPVVFLNYRPAFLKADPLLDIDSVEATDAGSVITIDELGEDEETAAAFTLPFAGSVFARREVK